jgi:hypothetical protein
MQHRSMKVKNNTNESSVVRLQEELFIHSIHSFFQPTAYMSSYNRPDATSDRTNVKIS